MSYTFRDLELFIAVVEEGSVTAGARALGMPLSSASARLTAMERSREIELLRRGRRGVQLTEAGELLLARARRIVAESRDLDRQLAAHSQGMRHEIRLATNTATVDALTEFLASTLSQFPDVRITLAETRSVDGARRVASGEVDMAVVSAPPEPEGLEVRRLWEDPLVTIRPPGLARAPGPPTFRGVLSGPMIGLGGQIPLQRLIDRHARLAGIEPSFRVRLPTLAAVCAVASTGAGDAIVPRGAALRLGVPAASLHLMDEAWTRREAVLITRVDPPRHEATETFIASLLAYCAEHEG